MGSPLTVIASGTSGFTRAPGELAQSIARLVAAASARRGPGHASRSGVEGDRPDDRTVRIEHLRGVPAAPLENQGRRAGRAHVEGEIDDDRGRAGDAVAEPA